MAAIPPPPQAGVMAQGLHTGGGQPLGLHNGGAQPPRPPNGPGITMPPTGQTQTAAVIGQGKVEKKDQWPKFLTDQPKLSNGKAPIFEAYVLRRAPTDSTHKATWRYVQVSKMRLSSNDILMYEKRGKDVMHEYDNLRTDSMRNAVDQVVEQCNTDEKDPIYEWDLANLDVTKRPIAGSRNILGYANAFETTQIRVIVRRDLKAGAVIPPPKDTQASTAGGAAGAINAPKNQQKPKGTANPQQQGGQVMAPPQQGGPTMGFPPQQGGGPMMGPPPPQGGPPFPQGIQMMGPPPPNQQRPMPPNMQIPPPPIDNMGRPMPYPPPHDAPHPINITNNNGIPPAIKVKKGKKQNKFSIDDLPGYVEPIHSPSSPNFDSHYDSDHGRKQRGRRKNKHSPRMSGGLHRVKSSDRLHRRHRHRRSSHHHHADDDDDSDSYSSSSESYASDSSEHSLPSSPYTSQSSVRDSYSHLHRKASRKSLRVRPKHRRRSHSAHHRHHHHHSEPSFSPPHVERDHIFQREIRTYLPYDDDLVYRDYRADEQLPRAMGFLRPALLRSEEEYTPLALPRARRRMPRMLTQERLTVPPRAPRPPHVAELGRQRMLEHEEAPGSHIAATRAYLQGRDDQRWDEAVRGGAVAAGQLPRYAQREWGRERRFEGSDFEAPGHRRVPQWDNLAGTYSDEWSRDGYP